VDDPLPAGHICQRPGAALAGQAADRFTDPPLAFCQYKFISKMENNFCF
jgi:hypothetical protein